MRSDETMRCPCGSEQPLGAAGWTAVPECSNGEIRNLCPGCAAKAHGLAKQLSALVGSSNVHLFSMYDGKSLLHDASRRPIELDLPASPEIDQAVRDMTGNPEPADVEKASVVVRAHRFVCGCGEGDGTWCFRFEGRRMGWPYKLTPEDAGMKLHEGLRLRVTFERIGED